MKRNFAAVAVFFVLLSVIILPFNSNSEPEGIFMANKEAGMILAKWLIIKDPELFIMGKIFINFTGPDDFTKYTDEGVYVIIKGELRGNRASFWINKKTKEVDCYISYCGKHSGNKYCGKEIADNLCMQ